MIDREAVCVSVQASTDWAMFVTAAREGNERRIVPMFWICEGAPLIPRCPNLGRWRHAGLAHVLKTGGWTPAQCGEALKAHVADALDGISKLYRIHAYKADPGLVSDTVRRITEKFQTLPNFPVTDEPVYAWFLQHEELAMRGHQYLRYLALGDSGSIPALSDLDFEERARDEENFIRYGDQPNYKERHR